jgi:hypothetical protein
LQINEKRVRERHLTSEQRDFHDLIWLHHVYLQLGQYHNANVILQDLYQEIVRSNAPLARRYYAHMHAVHCWAVGFSAPDGCTIDTNFVHQIKIDDLEVSRFTAELSAFGIQAVAESNMTRANQIVEIIRDRIKIVSEQILSNKKLASTPAPSHVTTHLYSVDSEKSVLFANIMLLQLEASIALKSNLTTEAFSLLHQSTALSDTLPYEDGAAMPPKPPHEYLADLLVQTGHYKEAVQEYQISLQNSQPHRSISLLGLARAASLSRNKEVCRTSTHELQHHWENADSEVKSVLSEIKCL